MKSFIILMMMSVTAFPARAESTSWQELSTHLFTNATIVWQVSTNQVPKSLWVYRRILPHVFSATVISNAVVLGSLQSRGFPRPSKKDFFIWEEKPPNWQGSIHSLLGIKPGDANLYFSVAKYGPVSSNEIPNEAAMVNLARTYAPRLGLDPAKLMQEKIYTHLCDTDQTTNNVCGRGVFFPRQLDGIPFFSPTDDGENAEGFSIEFGEHGKIQAFSVRWSEVEHYKNEPTISPDEIIRCLRSHKAIVMPTFKDGDFARLRKLATAKAFTITKITLYYWDYGEGLFGEVPVDDVPSQFATPFAELEAVADFEDGSLPVKLLCPILSSEMRRLMKNSR